MSGPQFPDTPPPEVPEEFHAAYLKAFRRALEEGEGQRGAHVAAQESVSHPEAAVAEPATHDAGSGTTYRTATPWERLRESSAFVPALVAALALLLIVGAYLVGAAFSREVDDQAAPAGSPQTTPATTESEPGQDPAGSPPAGKAVRPTGAKASCTAPPSQDSAGHRVTYGVARALDGEPDTAWRCTGRAKGETIVLELPEGSTVTRVGVVPGYAKTDPRSGVDRYSENNRITLVRWHLGDHVVEQRLDPDPMRRSMQWLDVPRSEVGEVTLEILKVRKGPRNTTAISEIELDSLN